MGCSLQYRSDSKSNIFICVMIINVDVTSSPHMHVQQPVRSKLLHKQINTTDKNASHRKAKKEKHIALLKSAEAHDIMIASTNVLL